MSADQHRPLQSAHTKGRAVVAVVALWSVFVFSYARWVNGNRPGVFYAEGWYGWWDQSQYLKLVQILSTWRLPDTAGDYLYGLGYPALAVPFYLLGFEGDPFAPVDLVLFCTVVVGSFFLGRNLRTPRFGLLLALVVSVATPVLGLMVLPWNSSVGVAALVVILAIATSASTITWQRSVAVGLMVGATFAARYVDGVVLALIVVLVVIIRKRGDSRRLAIGAALPTLMIVAAVLLSHALVFGSPLTTPYSLHTREDFGSDQSLANYDLAWVPRHAVQTFITGRADDGEPVATPPILLQFLMLSLAPAGLVGAVVVNRRRHGSTDSNTRLLVAVAVVSVASSVFYLSFVASSGGALDFHSARYWQMWFPYWALLALEGVWLLADWAQSPSVGNLVDDV